MAALGNMVQQLLNAQVTQTQGRIGQTVPPIPLGRNTAPTAQTTRTSGPPPPLSPSSPSSSSSSSSSSGSDQNGQGGNGNGGGNGRRNNPPSPPRCRLCGGQHDESVCPSRLGATTTGATTAAVVETKTKEEDVVRIKELEDMKFPAPPNDAARCRGYKNTVLTTIGGMQKTEGNEVYQWVLKCTPAKSIKELESSEGFPVLDRKIGVKLQASAKEGKFGMMFQTMIEETRRKQGAMPKGRQMLWRVFNEFDLERQRGGMIGHQQLLNVRLKGSSIADLEQFRDKVVFIRSSMEDEDLPKDTTLELFLYQQLKQHPKLTSMIDKYESSSLTSHRRSYEWLWTNMLAVITRHKTDANAQAVEKALQSSSSASVPAVPGLAEEHKGQWQTVESKNKKKKKKKNKQEVSAAPAPATPQDTQTQKGKKKGKGKSKGSSTPRNTPRSTNNGNTTPRGTPLTAEEKARSPCMCYAYKMCHAGNDCSFLHDEKNLYKGPAPRVVASGEGLQDST